MATTRGETFEQTRTGQVQPVGSSIGTVSTVQTVQGIHPRGRYKDKQGKQKTSQTQQTKELSHGALPVEVGKQASHYQWTDPKTGVTSTAYVVYKDGKPAYVSHRGKQIPISRIKAMGGVPIKFKKVAPIRRETLGEKTAEHLEDIGRIAPSGKYQILDFETGEFVAVPKSVFESRTKYYQDKAAFEAALRKESPNLYKIYKGQGIEAYNKEVERQNKEYEVWQQAINKVEPYRLTTTEAGMVTMGVAGASPAMSDSFDIVGAVKDAIYRKIDRETLETAFGKEAVDDAYKLILATSPTISARGTPPVLSKEEYAKLTSPPTLTSEQIKKLAPFVLTGDRNNEIDVKGMLKAGIDPKVVYQYIGGRQSGATLKEVQEQAKYLTATTNEKIGIMIDASKKYIKENPTAPLVVAADVLVPGVYVTRHWNELSVPEKTLFIAIDAISLIPIAAAVGAGARTVSVAGKLARIGGALKGAGRASVALAKAPIDMIIHPLGTAKATALQFRTLAENLLVPSKIPQAVISTADGLVMLRVGKDTTAAKALEFQKELLEAAKHGERIFVTIGDTTVELAQSPLMREIGGGLVHGSPDIAGLASGTEVIYKSGMPAKEQGLFVAHQPSIQFALKPQVPLAGKATGKMVKVARYKAADIVKLDSPIIKNISLADAKAIPDDLAPKLLEYLRKLCRTDPVTRIGGSFNEWLKVPKAIKPNDLDIATTNARQAQKEIIELARSLGYDARPSASKIKVEIKGKKIKDWTSIIDVDTLQHHQSTIPSDLIQPTTKVQGLNLENLGEQYLRQSYGSIVKAAAPEQELKIAQRIEKLDKAASLVVKKLKKMGATIRRPGFVIYSPETARKAEETRKLFFSKEAMEQIGQNPQWVAEMEEKFLAEQVLPKMKQRLFTRVGATGERLEIWLEKPLSFEQIAKLKAEALVELIKTPFKPSITVSKARGGSLTDEQVSRLADILKQSDNADIARILMDVNRELRLAVPRVASVLAPRLLGTRMTTPSLTRTGNVRPARLIGRPVSLPRTNTMSRPIVTMTGRAVRAREIPREARGTTASRQSREIAREIARLERLERANRLTDTDRLKLNSLRLKITTIEKPPRIITIITKDMTDEQKSIAFAHPAYRWKQGFGWWAINEKGQKAFFKKPLPSWNVGRGKTPAETIQTAKGAMPPERATLDLGIQDITVVKPAYEPGRKGAIKFTADPEQQTSSKIVLKIRGTSEKALKKLPLGTTLKQLVSGNYKETIPQSTIDKMLSEKVQKASRQELLSTLAPYYRTNKLLVNSVLRHIPDRERKQVLRELNEYSTLQAPIRGVPKAKLITGSLRRKKRTLKTGTRRETVSVI